MKKMPREEVLDLLQKYVTPYRITKGKGFRLKDFDPGDTGGLQIEKAEATDLLQAGTAWLAEEQDMLYAQDRWSLLLVFQAMDAAGKDGTINHVMSGVNPSRALKYPLDKHLYAQRHLVECCFSKLKQFRRVATRFEKTARNYRAVVTLATIVLWMR
jgi:transposase